MGITNALTDIFSIPVRSFTDPGNRTFLLYLATSLLIATLVQVRAARRAHREVHPLSDVITPQVYTHRSALVDYIYFITNSILYTAILAPYIAFGGYISSSLTEIFDMCAEPTAITLVSGTTITIIFSIALALAFDFGSFITHYILHKVPFLWEFHKVHHSAEVLTPITVYRMHPIDDILTMILSGLITGTIDAITRFFIAPGVSMYAVYGVGVLNFLFYISGYHLRHSHVWLSYGPTLGKFLISPAQHQIHHSKARRHWDKNFGFMFAFWDWMFGSLYIPKEREPIQFGIGNNEGAEYSSVWRLYLLPFVKAYRVLTK